MITKGQSDLFRQSVIAQDDDGGYDVSGWIAVAIGDWSALTRYGHCSCFDTWASVTGGGIGDYEGPSEPLWDWQGPPDKLVELAHIKADPGLPGRTSIPDDYDHTHLMKVYDQILDWDKNGRKPIER